MKVLLDKMNSEVYAMNPQIERIQGQNQMTLAHLGCTHVFVFCAPLNMEIDLMDTNIQSGLKNIGGEIFRGNEIPLEISKITVKSIDFITLQKRKGCIFLPEKAANYAICACRYDSQNEVIHLFLPDRNSFKYQASVSVEITYSITPYTISAKKGFWGFGGTVEKQTDYYKVVVGTEKVDFPSGGIIYTLDDLPYKYPITEKMRGKEMLIKANNGRPPRFIAVLPGLTLKQI